MGAAGDMLAASLLELTDDPAKSLQELNALGIPGVVFEAEKTEKSGIVGTHIHVLVNGEEEGTDEHHHHHDEQHHHDHEHHHHHSGMHDIEHIVRDHLKLSDALKDRIMSVYKLIGEAESTVHGVSVDEIHFHEVGSMDAIADITAVCYLIDKLDVERIIASPVHVGRGTVKCAHGIMPVPAPATAMLLKNIPIYSREEVEGELCTPTGAALLRNFVDEFCTTPLMKINKIGYGMGTKEFKTANCLRTMLCETRSNSEERIYELSFNVDDMTGEEIGFATQILLECGARDVFTIPVYMKKNRPGNMICVICDEAHKDELVRLCFKHTTTIGIRQSIHDRYVLKKEIENVDSDYGKVRIKRSHGYGISKEKYEYDDLSSLAKENGLSLQEIRNTIRK